MQCRPSSPIDHFSCSSLLSTSFHCTHTSKHDNYPSSETSRRRRRLEDPVITHASNYYVINPRQASHSALPPSSLQIQQASDRKNIYCDLYNLLELPSPMKQKKTPTLKDSQSSRNPRSIIYKSVHAKLKDINERKRYQQQSSSSKENKHQKEKFSSTENSNHFEEKGKSANWIYQRHFTSPGFFRRVVENYFCLPMIVAYEKLSN